MTVPAVLTLAPQVLPPVPHTLTGRRDITYDDRQRRWRPMWPSELADLDRMTVAPLTGRTTHDQ